MAKIGLALALGILLTLLAADGVQAMSRFHPKFGIHHLKKKTTYKQLWDLGRNTQSMAFEHKFIKHDQRHRVCTTPLMDSHDVDEYNSPEWHDYIHLKDLHCGCACIGPDCIKCPHGTISKNVRGRTRCFKCESPGELRGGKCMTANSNSEVTKEVEIPEVFSGDSASCTVEDHKVKCSVTSGETALKYGVHDGELCGEFDFKNDNEILEKEQFAQSLVTTEVTFRREAVFSCQDAHETLSQDEGTKKFYCKKTVTQAGSEVEMVERPIVCKKGDLVDFNRMICFVPGSHCPPKPPVTKADLSCAPSENPFLKNMFHQFKVVREFIESEFGEEDAKERGRECVFSCLSIAHRREQCNSLLEIIGGEGEFINQFAAWNEEVEDIGLANRVLDLMATCNSDLTAGFVGRLVPSETGSVSLVIPENIMARVRDKLPNPEGSWTEYATNNIPLKHGRGVLKQTMKTIEEDMELLEEGAGFEQFRRYVDEGNVPHNHGIAVRNCRVWAKGADERNQSYKGTCSDEATSFDELCVKSCFAHHINRVKGSGNLGDFTCPSEWDDSFREFFDGRSFN